MDCGYKNLHSEQHIEEYLEQLTDLRERQIDQVFCAG